MIIRRRNNALCYYNYYYRKCLRRIQKLKIQTYSARDLSCKPNEIRDDRTEPVGGRNTYRHGAVTTTSKTLQLSITSPLWLLFIIFFFDRRPQINREINREGTSATFSFSFQSAQRPYHIQDFILL